MSIESASYMENNDLGQNFNSPLSTEDAETESTPKLFIEEQNSPFQETLNENDNQETLNVNDNKESDQLFDQDINEDEDFEIPAF